MSNQRRPTQDRTHQAEENQSLSDRPFAVDHADTSPIGVVRGRSPGGNNQMLSVPPDAEEIATALNQYNAKTELPQNLSMPRRQLSPLAPPRSPAHPASSQPPETREPRPQIPVRSMLPKVAEALSKQNLSLPEQNAPAPAPTSPQNPVQPAPTEQGLYAQPATQNFHAPLPQPHDKPLNPQTRLPSLRGEQTLPTSKPQPQATRQKKARQTENEDQKRRQIEAYFGKRPFWIYLSILTGLALIFHPGRYDPFYGFQIALDAALIAGGTFILLGLFWRFFIITIPSDAQIDEWTDDELRALEFQAIEQMGFHESELIADPIVFTGYPDISKLGKAFRTSRYGKDHVLRYTPRALTIIAFRENDVLTFEGAVDLATGSKFYDSVNEFFYRDIATLAISRQTIKQDIKAYARFLHLLKPWRWAFIDRLNRLISGRHVNSSAQRNSRDVFTLNLINGQRVMTVLRDGRMAGDRDYEELPVTLENEVMPIIKELIRKKKNEQVGPEAKALLAQQKTDQ